MRRHATGFLASLAAFLLLAVVAAGCGGGNDKDAKALLRRAFATSIGSANVTVDVNVDLKGVPQLSQPIRVKLAGPYQSNGPKKLPSLSWDVSVAGGGQTFSAGLVLTKDNGFVNFQGTNYEIGSTSFAQFNQALGKQPSGSGGFSRFGVNPIDWIKGASKQGDSTVAGVTTQHVSAAVDIQKLFNDLNKVVSKARGQVAAGRPAQLTSDQINLIKQYVHDPKLDVYVGKADGKIRRAAASIAFDVPEKARSSARGLQGGAVTISVELAGVGEPQTITAPKGAKPISELTKQLGGISGLSGALGGAGATGGSSGSSGGSSSGGAPSGGSPNSQKFQRYAQCLNKAKPSDTAALNRCSRLLK
jgi:hypothetical protein